MGEPGPSLPPAGEWQRLGVQVESELHAGMQSRVFAATVGGQRVALKLTDARLADAALVAERLRMTGALAALTPVVAAPVRLGGALLQQVGAWLASATSFVDGRGIDLTSAGDARLMGETLAGLHDALGRLPAFAIPPVAALAAGTGSGPAAAAAAGRQLLHGDFNALNVIVTPAGPRLIDFDDCGYGPVAFDVANALYMVLFDASVGDRPKLYATFRPGFLAGYRQAAGRPLDDGEVDGFIDARVAALGRWLDDLPNAPIGIRTSSPEWLQTLRAFVAGYRSGHW